MLWTVCFLGHVPKLPGTITSLGGLGLFLLVRQFTSSTVSSPLPFWGMFALMTLVSVWLAPIAERSLGKKDPSSFVVDELAGVLGALLFIGSPPTIWQCLVGFGFFRLFDIFKPPPIRRLETMRGSLGVTLDDLGAACYAQMCWRVAFFIIGRLW